MYRVPTVEDRFWERLVERSSHTYPWKIHEDWLSHHLRIFPRTGRTRLNNPSLLEVEAGLVYLSDSHSTPLFSTLLTQCGGLSPRPKYKTEKVQPSVAGQSYHITGDLRNSTKVGTPYWRRKTAHNKPKLPTGHLPVERPFQRIYVDSVEHKSESVSAAGVKCKIVLSMMNHLTKSSQMCLSKYTLYRLWD